MMIQTPEWYLQLQHSTVKWEFQGLDYGTQAPMKMGNIISITSRRLEFNMGTEIKPPLDCRDNSPGKPGQPLSIHYFTTANQEAGVIQASSLVKSSRFFISRHYPHFTNCALWTQDVWYLCSLKGRAAVFKKTWAVSIHNYIFWELGESK